MEQDFLQLRTSGAIRFFHQGFKDKWNLRDVYDDNAPCVFMGIYNAEDINAVENHKGEKILIFTGQDIVNYERLKHLNCISDQYVFGKKIILPIKDYSMFKPVPLGDKIYVYMSTPSPGFEQKFRMDIVRQLMEHFGKDMFIVGYHGHKIEFMMDEYYAKSFINLQLNKDAGFTTVLEMAHMGRYSISNYSATFCLPWNSTEDIIKHIIDAMGEGNITREIPNLNDFLFNSNEWLTLNFWKQ